jgi:hypothetical protein
MAGAGKKTFTAGEVLTASDVNTYLMEQSVMVFGGTAARSSAIPTPSEGMTSYRTDTQQIESYDGAEWRGMSGLQLVKKQTIGSGVSSITVTGAFSSSYDNYKIIISGGSSSAGSYLNTILGSVTTGYNAGYLGFTYASTTSNAGQNNGAAWAYSFFADGSNGINGSMELLNPFAAKPTYFNSTCATNLQGLTGQGFNTSSTSFTAFTITTNGPTLTGGTIYVYGYGV